MSTTSVEAMPVDQQMVEKYSNGDNDMLFTNCDMAVLCSILQQHNTLMSNLINELVDVKNELHHIRFEIARK